MWKEDVKPNQVAVRLGQLLTEQTLDRFQEETENSPLDQNIKTFIKKEFYRTCNIKDSVRYMMNYHVANIREVGFVFDWVLKNREARIENET